jgi:hypothetical protein
MHTIRKHIKHSSFFFFFFLHVFIPQIFKNALTINSTLFTFWFKIIPSSLPLSFALGQTGLLPQ